MIRIRFFPFRKCCEVTVCVSVQRSTVTVFKWEYAVKSVCEGMLQTHGYVCCNGLAGEVLWACKKT